MTYFSEDEISFIKIEKSVRDDAQWSAVAAQEFSGEETSQFYTFLEELNLREKHFNKILYIRADKKYIITMYNENAREIGTIKIFDDGTLLFDYYPGTREGVALYYDVVEDDFSDAIDTMMNLE